MRLLNIRQPALAADMHRSARAWCCCLPDGLLIFSWVVGPAAEEAAAAERQTRLASELRSASGRGSGKSKSVTWNVEPLPDGVLKEDGEVGACSTPGYVYVASICFKD